MKILLYEYTRATSDSSIAAKLRPEGNAMFQAILRDLLWIGDVEVHVLAMDDLESFRLVAPETDYSIIVAPETAGILEERIRWVEETGSKLTSPSSEQVRLVSDKYQLAMSLHARGLPVPRASLPDEHPLWIRSTRCVLKPRRGAGSQSTYLLTTDAEGRIGQLPRTEESMMLQEYIEGDAVSVVSFVGPAQRIVLPPASQKLSDDGRFRYLGGVVPCWKQNKKKIAALAHRVLNALPGLRGYVGMDMVVGPNGPVLIEINPRWTTSYLGLRACSTTNLAEALLKILAGERVPRLRWKEGRVSFTPSGEIHELHTRVH